MYILELKREDEAEFDRLAFHYGTIFSSSGWTKIFSNRVHRYGIYNKGGELIGGFITYRKNIYGLSVYRNPPFTPHVGPFWKIDASNPVTLINNSKKILSLICGFLEKIPYAAIMISFNRTISDMQPFIWKKFKVNPGYTYILDLSLTPEELLKRMSSERRKNITKAQKDRLIVNRISDLKIIKALVTKTFVRQNKKIIAFYMDKILFDFAVDNNSFAFATFRDNKPIACSLCIYDRNTAYYLLGGYDSNEKHHGAGTLSLWECIKHSKIIGLKEFDFEGSMIPHIETYFRGFGGNLVPYYRISKAKLPLELLLKFIKREIF